MPSDAAEHKSPAQSADSPLKAGLHAISGPTVSELALLVGLTFLVLIGTVAVARGYSSTVDNFGDSSAYMSVASAIRRWDFQALVIKQFWGLPYAMAALSKLTGLSDRTTLLVFSLLPSLITVLLARRLWDGWVAGYFAVLNFDWLQRSCLGGSEPLFVCLLLAAFLAVRQQRWLLAALLASLATTVRPLGIFALVGIGLSLLWKRDLRRFAAASAIGLGVGFLYSLPLFLHFGNALANVSSYHSKEWAGGWLFGFPFYAIVKGTLTHPAPWSNLIRSFGWIGLVTIAMVVMAKSAEFRAYCKSHAVEALFLLPYLWCLYTYNYPSWARSNFGRFTIPVLPFVFLALYRWLPKNHAILWGLGGVSAVLAAGSALGIENVLHKLR